MADLLFQALHVQTHENGWAHTQTHGQTDRQTYTHNRCSYIHNCVLRCGTVCVHDGCLPLGVLYNKTQKCKINTKYSFCTHTEC